MKHTFTNLQLLNITTGRLHTGMDDIYKFFNEVIEDGIMTHMIPNAYTAILPIMKEILATEFEKGVLFTEGYHPQISVVNIEFEFTEAHKDEFWKIYGGLDSPLLGKKVIVAKVD